MIRLIGVSFFQEKRVPFNEVLTTFLKGNFGLGAYYYWVMLGFLLVFPLLKWLIFKYDVQGLFIVGIMNLFYCLACECYQFEKDIDDVLVFRYLLLPLYWNYEYRIFTYWSKTSMMVSFWVFPLIYMAMKIAKIYMGKAYSKICLY